MKKYVYLIVDENNRIIAAYDDAKVAQKLLAPIENKLGVKAKVKQQILNSDLSTVG